MSKRTPASLLCDFYKVAHREQYPDKTQIIYSTWTPRASRIKGINSVVSFGIQGFIQEYLIDYFRVNFFDRPKSEVVAEYERYLKFALFIEKPYSKHIADLHDLGYLPILIRAIEEGTSVPIRVPMMTIENTVPEFYWVTNWLETLLSCSLWQPPTSATIAREYWKLLDKWCEETGGNPDFVQFQGHDFSYRGMGSHEAACKSGAGHLLSFVGTDTIPAIGYLEEYYGANIEHELVGCSVPASEHSVASCNSSIPAFSQVEEEYNNVTGQWVITQYLP